MIDEIIHTTLKTWDRYNWNQGGFDWSEQELAERVSYWKNYFGV